VTGHIQSDFDRAGRQRELAESGRLCLPAEAADLAVLHAADTAADFGVVAEAALGGRDEDFVGNRVDQPSAEQRRRVPLRERDLERREVHQRT
jgi:hypothetical protein